MFNLGKKARKNLVGLLRSFNLQAAKVNKLYADEPNFQPVPSYTVEEFMSNVNSKSDYRRETERLRRFFKKNRADAQDKVYVDVGGEIYTVVKWMYKEQRNIRRAETAKRNKAKKARELIEGDGGEDNFPPPVPPTPTTQNYEAQQNQYADSSIDRLVLNYVKALSDNGWLQTDEGKKVLKIIRKMYNDFKYYLESLLWGGGEGEGAIDFLYFEGSPDSGSGYSINYSAQTSWQVKVDRLMKYWYKKLKEAGLDDNIIIDSEDKFNLWRDEDLEF